PIVRDFGTVGRALALGAIVLGFWALPRLARRWLRVTGAFDERTLGATLAVVVALSTVAALRPGERDVPTTSLRPNPLFRYLIGRRSGSPLAGVEAPPAASMASIARGLRPAGVAAGLRETDGGVDALRRPPAHVVPPIMESTGAPPRGQLDAY